MRYGSGLVPVILKIYFILYCTCIWKPRKNMKVYNSFLNLILSNEQEDSEQDFAIYYSTEK